MDNYRVDSHKMMYHPERLSLWLKGRDIYPIYVEISVSGVCNHRCMFCALDYLKEYKTSFIETKTVKKFISSLAKKGVKSVLFSGEGEPLLHKDIIDIISHTKRNKIDTALTTNGVLLKENILTYILPELSWLRVSLNAGTRTTYAIVHRTNPGDFDTVLSNLEEAVRTKRKNKYNCVIGAQFLLLKQNLSEIKTIAVITRKIGLDYLIIKPYSQHPFSKNRLGLTLDYKNFLKLEQEMAQFSNDKFRVIFRSHAMQKLTETKPYKRCLGMPFIAHLACTGDLYGCSTFLGDKSFCYGNIYKQSFEQIWKGPKRKEISKRMNDNFNARGCRKACRLDEINRYLWELKNPPLHVNFI